ncbi:unnamed protein product [Moneuplotes crassus]|uniref:Uncharacterized protein n=1 Tax=Euplotes crassus TaxID=5936 RepID=A0AAD2D2R1_EUPCR|nr:unnamed protein product [Moneuplotes crassus]
MGDQLEKINKDLKNLNKMDKYTGSMNMFLDKSIFTQNLKCTTQKLSLITVDNDHGEKRRSQSQITSRHPTRNPVFIVLDKKCKIGPPMFDLSRGKSAAGFSSKYDLPEEVRKRGEKAIEKGMFKSSFGGTDSQSKKTTKQYSPNEDRNTPGYNKSLQSNSEFPNPSEMFSREILQEMLPPVLEQDRFGEYYKEITDKIAKKFSSNRWSNLKKDIEKQKGKASKYRQEVLQKRVESKLKFSLRSGTRRNFNGTDQFKSDLLSVRRHNSRPLGLEKRMSINTSRKSQRGTYLDPGKFNVAPRINIARKEFDTKEIKLKKNISKIDKIISNSQKFGGQSAIHPRITELVEIFFKNVNDPLLSNVISMESINLRARSPNDRYTWMDFYYLWKNLVPVTRINTLKLVNIKIDRRLMFFKLIDIPTLENLHLVNCGMNHDDLLEIKEVLLEGKIYLTTLEFSSNLPQPFANMDSEEEVPQSSKNNISFSEVLLGVSKSHSLEEFIFRDNNISSASMKLMNVVMRYGKNLAKIDFSHNPLGDRGVHLLFSKIAKNRSIKEIVLENISMTNVGAREIAKFLVTNKSLKSLILDENEIDIEGFYEIMEAVKKNKVLTKIQMLNCPLLDLKLVEKYMKKYKLQVKFDFRCVTKNDIIGLG